MSLTMLRTAAPLTRPFAARALYAGPSLLLPLLFGTSRPLCRVCGPRPLPGTALVTDWPTLRVQPYRSATRRCPVGCCSPCVFATLFSRSATSDVGGAVAEPAD